ncbi:hypothetical protein CJ030_MR1G025591 [Morella rubra]|nr:hypothetical protein CJ030_MR1G025591 [Morella rubra]
MTITASKSKNPENQSLPPRRGQIKREIFKCLVMAIGSVVVGFRRKNTETGGFLSSKSATPAATRSGYNSDNPSEKNNF